MKNIVILSAGIGSRLRPLTSDLPKTCIKVGEKTIISRLVSQVTSSNEEQNIITVIGYLGDKVVAELSGKFPDVNFVFNDDYESTNNLFSCMLALRSISNGDVVIVNGDCIYEDEIVTKMLSLEVSSIAVDRSIYYSESMKVSVSDGFVKEISKDLKEGPNVFTSIDLYYFSENDWRFLLNIMEEICASGRLGEWTEVAIDQLTKSKNVGVIDFADKNWVEVDNIEDLNKAKNIWG
jgi:choline kinase